MSRSPAEIKATSLATIDLLLGWLRRGLKTEQMQWLDTEINCQTGAVDDRRLSIAIGLVRRRLGRSMLSLTANDLTGAQELHQQWRPDDWTTDEGVRVALVLATWRGDVDLFATRVGRLCITGELTEHVACLKGFAVFPAQTKLIRYAREGARSSVQSVFEAIACHNPYPADYFDDAAYNQMVVKCVFSGVSIDTIVGLDERRNSELVRMMCDLVSERRAAGRPLPEKVHRWIASQ